MVVEVEAEYSYYYYHCYDLLLIYRVDVVVLQVIQHMILYYTAQHSHMLLPVTSNACIVLLEHFLATPWPTHPFISSLSTQAGRSSERWALCIRVAAAVLC